MNQQEIRPSRMETDTTSFNKIDRSSSGSQPSGQERDQTASTSCDNRADAYQYLRPSWWNPAAQGRITPAVIWNGFKEQTTAHGIPRLARAKGAVKNVFWGIAVTLAFGFLLYNFVKITATFFAFQTSVRLSLQNENQLKFPVITLCNMNPLRRTAMERVGLVAGTAYRTSGERRKRNVRTRRETGGGSITAEPENAQQRCCCTCCYHAFDGDDVITDCNTCGAENMTEAVTCARNVTVPTRASSTTTVAPKTTTTIATNTTHKPTSIPGSRYPERIQTTEKFQQENKITEMVSNLPEGEQSELGYKSSEMILDCQYSGTECNISSFVKFFNPTHGNCYMFNSGWDRDDEVRTASKTGRRYGLHVIININQAEYSDVIGDTAGVRMVIHPQNRMPFPEDEGITISPGRATSVGIRQVVVTREDHPYSDCVDPDGDHSDVDMYEELYPVSYSANACQKTCYQRHVIKDCGCADAYLPMHAAALTVSMVKACNSSNIMEDKLYSKRDDDEDDDDHDDEYNDDTVEDDDDEDDDNVDDDDDDDDIMMIVMTLLERYKEKIGSSFDIYDDTAYKENLIKLEVYYEEFNFETIDEVPSYKPGRYLSDIGGALGLWVGFSILSIAEFVELSMDLTVYFGGWLRRKLTARTQSGENRLELSPRNRTAAGQYGGAPSGRRATAKMASVRK
ncbi:hypothetical protein LSH36_137g07058 [Paralvinella palmiformis]|uniref:Uncharacterized protein n=1 Tax=Paralvinella palmiformis TaxID=53620 RepID=A0AAD9JWG5_9ANNE|nr:hypothetical protein LSH36_137g07058 [Paralvinella palmiformis]